MADTLGGGEGRPGIISHNITVGYSSVHFHK